MKLTDEEIVEIKEMRSRTPPVPWKQIAEWIGCSISTVRYHGDPKIRTTMIEKCKRQYHKRKYDSQYIENRKRSCNAWYAKNRGKRTLKKVLLGDLP